MWHSTSPSASEPTESHAFPHHSLRSRGAGEPIVQMPLRAGDAYLSRRSVPCRRPVVERLAKSWLFGETEMSPESPAASSASTGAHQFTRLVDAVAFDSEAPASRSQTVLARRRDYPFCIQPLESHCQLPKAAPISAPSLLPCFLHFPGPRERRSHLVRGSRVNTRSQRHGYRRSQTADG